MILTHDQTVALKAAKGKYRQLAREIAKCPNEGLRRDLMHTHSKLGLFLEEVLGDAWRAASHAPAATA